MIGTVSSRRIPVLSVLSGLFLAFFLLAAFPGYVQADNNSALNSAEGAPRPAPSKAQAEAPAEAPAAKVQKPAPSAAPQADALPVFIEHDGKDKLGLRLAMKLKEYFEKKKEFRLAKKNERAVKLMLSTRVEIAERPYFGSVYSVVWMFVEGKDVLAYYLDNTLDFTASTRLDEDVEALVARTDKVAEKYSYLME